MTNQLRSKMISRGRVCTSQLREMRVSGKRFPRRASHVKDCKRASTGFSQCAFLAKTEMNRPWDLSKETNVGNKQLGSGASAYASLAG